MTVIIKEKYTEAKMCRAVKFYEKHVALGLVKLRKEKIRDGMHRILKDKKKNVHDTVSLGIVRIAILLEESHQYFLKCTEYKGI